MQRAEWDGIAQQFLNHKNYAAGTIEHYTASLKRYFDWCEGQGIEPEDATTGQLLLYREGLRRSLAENTANSRFKNVRSFYEYLRRVGRVHQNPTDLIQPTHIGLNARDLLTVDQLGRVWDISEGRDRIVVGLLALCAMVRDEVRSARAEDLHQRQGVLTINVRGRRGANDLGWVAIPGVLAKELISYLAGRRTGYILQGTGDSGITALTYINGVVRRVAKKADLGFSFTSITLTETLRSLAIVHRFSYASVLRTTSHGSPQRRTALVKDLELTPDEHASMRLGRMLETRDSEVELSMFRAETLLSDRGQHPATAVMVASATLESVLRDHTAACGIHVTKKDPTLATYGSLLRSHAHITVGQLRTIERILTFRNDAAHGWFERVSREDASWTVHEAQKLVHDLVSGP